MYVPIHTQEQTREHAQKHLHHLTHCGRAKYIYNFYKLYTNIKGKPIFASMIKDKMTGKNILDVQLSIHIHEWNESK